MRKLGVAGWDGEGKGGGGGGGGGGYSVCMQGHGSGRRPKKSSRPTGGSDQNGQAAPEGGQVTELVRKRGGEGEGG